MFSISKALPLLACILFAGNVQAAMHLYSFNGSISAVDTELLGVFTVGDSVSGSYRIDDTLVSFVPDNGFGAGDRYVFAATGLEATFSNAYTVMGAGGTGVVEIGLGFGSEDELFTRFNASEPGFSAADVGGFAASFLSVRYDWDGFTRPAGTLITDIDIGGPDFIRALGELGFGGPSFGPNVNFVITSADVTTVPLPPALVLLGSALLLFAGMKSTGFQGQRTEYPVRA